eukprot:4044314-Lingulodinium_polyedra.AAC.1
MLSAMLHPRRTGIVRGPRLAAPKAPPPPFLEPAWHSPAGTSSLTSVPSCHAMKKVAIGSSPLAAIKTGEHMSTTGATSSNTNHKHNTAKFVHRLLALTVEPSA